MGHLMIKLHFNYSDAISRSNSQRQQTKLFREIDIASIHMPLSDFLCRAREEARSKNLPNFPPSEKDGHGVFTMLNITHFGILV